MQSRVLLEANMFVIQGVFKSDTGPTGKRMLSLGHQYQAILLVSKYLKLIGIHMACLDSDVDSTLAHASHDFSTRPLLQVDPHLRKRLLELRQAQR